MRTLFYFALGGSITLNILAASGSGAFDLWRNIFTIASVPLFIGYMIAMVFGDRGLNQKSINEAVEQGRVRAAMIVSRRQTGTFVNEQPMVEFTLLVDRRGGDAFLAKARRIVSLLDLHEVVPGALVTVVHPNPDTGKVYFADRPVPPSSRVLTLEGAENAKAFPEDPSSARHTPTALKRLIVFAVAFVLGAVAGPLLATPNAFSYAKYAFVDDPESVERLEHPSLFDPENVWVTVENFHFEIKHDEAYAVFFSEFMFQAYVPATDGADGVSAGERITMQSHEVTGRDPLSSQLVASYEAPFSIDELDWDVIFDSVDTAQQLASDRGLVDPQLERVFVDRASTDLAPIEVRLTFVNEHDSLDITLDVNGELLPGELLKLKTEAELATYLFEPQAFDVALSAVLAAAGTDQAIRFMHQGSWVEMEAYTPTTDGSATITTVTFRDGRIEGLEDRPASSVEHEKVFDVRDIDWTAVLTPMPDWQTLMADAGAAGATPSHILARHSHGTSAPEVPLAVHVYLYNEANDGGYVVLNPAGEVLRVHGP